MLDFDGCFRSRRSSILVAAFAVVAAAAPARAHDGHERHFPSERLEPCTAKEAIINTSWAAVPEPLAWDAALMLAYSNDPLFTYFISSAGQPDDRNEVLVENRITGHLTASLALFEWIELGLEVPVLLTQQRDNNFAPAADAGSLVSSGMGDLRLVPKARVIRQRDGAPLDIGLQIPFTLPTGQFSDYFGRRATAFRPPCWRRASGLFPRARCARLQTSACVFAPRIPCSPMGRIRYPRSCWGASAPPT